MRERHIDCVRGFAIILMLIGHSGVPSGLHVYIYGFHMPLFYVLSGYLFNENWLLVGCREFIFYKFKAYIIPYITFCLINLVINIPVEKFNDTLHGNYFMDICWHLKWILYSYPMVDKMPNCTPLWFLTSIFICNIYFYFLQKNKKVIVPFLISAILITRGLDYFLCPIIPWHIDISMIGCMFMLFGYWLKKYGKYYLPQKKIYIISLFCISSILIMHNGKINIGARVF